MSESPKSILNDLEFGLDRLRESLEELIETVNREQRQATKEGFAVLLNHGFNVGVSFLLKDCKTVWKITGICSSGFVVSYQKDGETKTLETVLDATNAEKVEKLIQKLTIIPGGTEGK